MYNQISSFFENIFSKHQTGVLPNLSKIFENLMYNQISSFFENIFSKHQTGFPKGFNSQSCLVEMIKKSRK